MSITFIYRGETSLPVEIQGLTPDWAQDKSLTEIERFGIFHGNQKLPVAELFSVSGDAGDKRFDFEGYLAGVHWIGAHMRSGQIHIRGSAGRHLGSELRGGEIHVAGDCADWLGCEMRGGLIHVRGNASQMVGVAYRGSEQGMRGGTIIVDGNAGNETGLSMKDGLIAIGGHAGDMIGFNMTGGAVLVLGGAGIRHGAGMQGGSIALFGALPSPVLSTFRFDRTAKPERLAAAEKVLNSRGVQSFGSALAEEMDVYIGDAIAEGTGEIYLRRRATG